MGGVHLQRGGGNVDEVEPEQRQVVVVDDIGTDAVDEVAMVPTDAGRCAKDPRGQGLDRTAQRGDRVADDPSIRRLVRRGPSPLESQGGRRILDVDLVSLCGERFGEIPDVVCVAPEVVRRVERRRHEKRAGLHSPLHPARPAPSLGDHRAGRPIAELNLVIRSSAYRTRAPPHPYDDPSTPRRA